MKSLCTKAAAILLVAAISLLLLPFAALKASARNPHAWTELCQGLIAHALGGVESYAGSNSFDALAENYRLGHRVFEVDLNLTTDGELAAVHDWQSYMGQKSSDEWKAVRIAGKYTAMLLQDILDFMMEHPDMYLVTDTKSFEYSESDMVAQFQILHDRAFERGGAELLDRIVPQIYNQNMYHRIGEIYRYPSIIYTLYASPDNDAQVVAFVRDRPDIIAITMAPVRFSTSFHEQLSGLGKLIYFFTLNDPGEISSYRDMGVHGFYTDFVYPRPELNISPWALDSVSKAIEVGLVPADMQSRYLLPISRSEFCSLAVELYEAVTGTVITGRRSFSDTDDINVEKAAAIGIIAGIGNNRFAPNDTLTREQAAVIISRLANVFKYTLPAQTPSFADNGSISTWAMDSAGRVQAAGIMNGMENNMFAPKAPITREQSIITLLRLYDLAYG